MTEAVESSHERRAGRIRDMLLQISKYGQIHPNYVHKIIHLMSSVLQAFFDDYDVVKLRESLDELNDWRKRMDPLPQQDPHYMVIVHLSHVLSEVIEDAAEKQEKRPSKEAESIDKPAQITNNTPIDIADPVDQSITTTRSTRSGSAQSSIVPHTAVSMPVHENDDDTPIDVAAPLNQSITANSPSILSDSSEAATVPNGTVSSKKVRIHENVDTMDSTNNSEQPKMKIRRIIINEETVDTSSDSSPTPTSDKKEVPQRVNNFGIEEESEESDEERDNAEGNRNRVHTTLIKDQIRKLGPTLTKKYMQPMLRPVDCGLCELSCINYAQYLSHVKMSHSEIFSKTKAFFNCGGCGKEFLTAMGVKSHLIRAHLAEFKFCYDSIGIIPLKLEITSNNDVVAGAKRPGTKSSNDSHSLTKRKPELNQQEDPNKRYPLTLALLQGNNAPSTAHVMNLRNHNANNLPDRPAATTDTSKENVVRKHENDILISIDL